jgi:hypothetical protein
MGADSSLLARLSQVPDRRKRRGRRHELVVVLALTACAMLVVGNDSVAAIWQRSAGTGQEVLARLGARRDALRDRYLVPSERTFRRVLADLDGEALDRATCGFAADVTRGVAPVPVVACTAGPVEREQRRTRRREDEGRVPSGRLSGAAVDGKALRGSVGASGARTFLVGAISHGSGVVLVSARFLTRKERVPRSRHCWPRWTPREWCSPWMRCTPRRRPPASSPRT